MAGSGTAVVLVATTTLAGCGVYGLKDHLHFEPEVRAPGQWRVEVERVGTTRDVAAVRMINTDLEVRVRAPDPVATGGEAWVLVNIFPFAGGKADYPTQSFRCFVEVYCHPPGSCEAIPRGVKLAAPGTSGIGYNDAALLAGGDRLPLAPDKWTTLDLQVTIDTTTEAFDLVFDEALLVDGKPVAVPRVGMKVRRVPRPFVRYPQ